jgi:hypothetical protein
MNYSPATIEAIKSRFRDHSPEQFLSNPESYLGPNYAAVINFWTFHDSLTHDQFETVSHRWIKILNNSVGLKCKTFLNEIQSLILDIDENFIIHFLYKSERRASEELIVMHKLLEDGDYEMPFVKLYDNL